MFAARSLALVLLATALVPASSAGPVQASPYCAPFESAFDDAGSGRDATEADPVRLAPGRHVGCIGQEEPESSSTHGRDDLVFAAVAGDRYDLLIERLGCGRLFVAVENDGFTEDWGSGDGCGTRVVAYTAQTTGDHRIVLRRGSDNGAYALTLAHNSPEPRGCLAQDDAETGQDAPAKNGPWIAPGAHAGCLDRYDDEDAFRVAVPPDHRVVIRAESDDCRVTFNAGSSTNAGTFFEGCGPHVIEIGRYGGTLHVVARTTDDVHTTYGFSIALTPLGPPACRGMGDGGTPWDAGSRVLPLGLGATTGCVDDVDTLDIYETRVAGGEHLRLTIRPRDCGDVELWITSETAFAAPSGVDDPCAHVWRLLGEEDSIFYVEVWRITTEGVYDVTLEREATGCPSIFLRAPIVRGVPEPSCLDWITALPIFADP